MAKKGAFYIELTGLFTGGRGRGFFLVWPDLSWDAMLDWSEPDWNDWSRFTPASRSKKPHSLKWLEWEKTDNSCLIAKSRTVSVRLISMALTGYFRTMVRPRVHRPLSMLKYDPVVKKKVLFLEATKGGRAR